MHVDVACAASVESLFENLKDHSVPVSIVVHCAGIFPAVANVVDTSEKTFDKVINVNLKASQFRSLPDYTSK